MLVRMQIGYHGLNYISRGADVYVGGCIHSKGAQMDMRIAK